MRILTCLMVYVAAVFSVSAEMKTEDTVRAGKLATALIESKDGSASAFCVHSSGVFVSNAHAVPPVGEAIKVILNPAEADQKVVTAKVIRRNEVNDLALFRMEGSAPPPLLLGDDNNLVETTQVFAFGYPFGNLLALKDQKYPNISVNGGRVTSLRKTGGKLATIQLDATLNPGNSGGPVLDGNGKVIGVVSSGVIGTGINFAIPVNLLADLLAQPDIIFTPPQVKFADRHNTQKLQIAAMTFSVLKNPKVRVSLKFGREEPRQFEAHAEGKDMFSITEPLVVASAAVPRLPVRIDFANGRVEGTIAERIITIAGKSVKVAACKEIYPGPKGKVVLVDGGTLEGSVGDLGRTDVDLGDTVCQVDLMKALRIDIQDSPALSSVEYRITMTDGDRVVAEKAGTIPLLDPPADSSNGLVGFWRFDEGGGESVQDHSLKRNSGIVHNGTFVEGKSGKALHFKGDGFVEIPGAKAFVGVGPLSFSVWVKADAWSSPWGGRRILQCSNGLELSCSTKGNEIKLVGGEPATVVTVPTPSANEWHHIAGIVAEAGLQLYIDGKLAGEKKAPVMLKASGEPLYIGVTRAGAVPGDHFTGAIDEVRIYNRALSADEIQSLARQ